MVALNPADRIGQANDARRKSDLSQVQKALEMYYSDNESYPAGDSAINYEIDGNDWGGTGWQPYMGALPKDPNSTKKYVYVSDGQSYYLYASLDRGGNDPQACNGGNACSNVPSGVVCGETTDVCNYGVSSPNVSL